MIVGMTKTAKVAISLPTETLHAIEVIRKEMGLSRSALIREALEHWLQARETSPEDQRYIQGYLKTPEPADQADAVASAATAHWSEWE